MHARQVDGVDAQYHQQAVQAIQGGAIDAPVILLALLAHAPRARVHVCIPSRVWHAHRTCPHR